MEDNPYQSPLTPPVKRRAVTISVLTLLAIPAAAIAGSRICSAASAAAPTALGTIESLLFAFIGLLLNVIILALAHRVYLPIRPPNFLIALFFTFLATPFALLTGYVVGAMVIVFTLFPATPIANSEWPAYTGLFVVGIMTQIIWGTAFWYGLLWKRR